MLTWVDKEGAVHVLVHEDGRLAQVGDRLTQVHSGLVRELRGTSYHHVHIECYSTGKKYADWPDFYHLIWREL